MPPARVGDSQATAVTPEGASSRVVYRTLQTYDGDRFFGITSKEKQTRP